MKIKHYKFFEVDGGPSDPVPSDPEIEIEVEDDEQEIVLLASRVDTLEAKNSELQQELTRAHERCRVLEDRLNSGDSLPKSIHPWFKPVLGSN